MHLCLHSPIRLYVVALSFASRRSRVQVWAQRRFIVSCTRPNYVTYHHTFTCIRVASRHCSTNCWRCDYSNTNKQAEDNNWSNWQNEQVRYKGQTINAVYGTASEYHSKWYIPQVATIL